MPDFASMLYSGAQQSEQQQGSGIAGGIQQGAQLALQKQQLDIQQQHMQMQMQQLQQAKVQKLYDFMGAGLNIQNAADRKSHFAMAEGFNNAMGQPMQIDPDALKSLGTDEYTQRLATLDTMVRNVDPTTGKPQLDPASAIDLATNPLKRDQFLQITPTPLELINKRPDLNAAQQFATDEGNKIATQKIAQQKADIEEQKATNDSRKLDLMVKNQGKKQTNTDNKLVQDTSKQQMAALKPYEKQSEDINSALDARDRLQASLLKDPSGRSASPVDLGGMVYSMLHTELGRVNSIELEHQTGIPGLQNKTQDQIVKALGGVNPAIVPLIAQRLGSTAQQLDVSKKHTADALSGTIDNLDIDDDKKAALKQQMSSLTKPVYRPPPTNIGGHIMTAPQMQQFLANPANANTQIGQQMQQYLQGGQ